VSGGAPFGKIYQYGTGCAGKGAQITAANTLVTDSQRRIVYESTTAAPPAGEKDSFNYKVTDNRSPALDSLTTQLVRIEVSHTALPPTAIPCVNAAACTTDEDTPLLLTLGCTQDASPCNTATIVSLPAKGILRKVDNTVITAAMLPYSTLDSGGGFKQIRYVPTFGDFSIAGAPVASFDFIVTDLSGLASASVRDNIIVTHVNHPPTASPQTVSVPEDGSVTITIVGADPDVGNTITFAMTSITPNGGVFCAGAASGCGSPLGATSSIPGSGFSAQVTYTPPRGVSGSPFASFNYRTTDQGAANSAAATVTINVLPGNHPPVGQSFTVNTPQDTPVAIVFTARMTDPDQAVVAPGVFSTPRQAVIVSVPPPGFGSIYQSAGGVTLGAKLAVDSVVDTTDTIVFVPEPGTFSYRPPAGAVTYTTFDYNVRDNPAGMLSVAPATVTLQVSFVYQSPVVPTRSVSVPEDNSLAIFLTATSPGTPTATFTYTIVSITSPNGCLGNIDETKRCVFTTSTGAPITTFPTFTGPLPLSDNVFSFQPGLDENGPNYAIVTYRANDGTSNSPNGVLTINVDPINDPPIPNSRSLVSTLEDTPVTIELTGSDIDGPLNPPEIVLLSAPPAAVGSLYTYNAANSPTFVGVPLPFNKTGDSPLPDNGGQKMIAVVRHCEKFVFVPGKDWNGQLTIQYRAWDNLVFSVPALTRLLTIKVIPVNDAPTLVFLNTEGTGPLLENKVSVAPGAQLLIKPLITDVDAEETLGGELKVTLTYSKDSQLEQATSAARSKKDNAGATTTKTVEGTLKQIQNALATLNYKRDVAGTDTLVMVVDDQGNTGLGGPKKATTTLTITVAVPAVVAPPATDNTGVVVGAAFAGVFGALAAYAGWTKLHPKLFQQDADPFSGQAAGGENPLFEGQGFTSNALYEARGQ
jgi:hypothetical protein